MKHIQTSLYNFLCEATYLKDAQYSQEANDFFDKMIEDLEKGNYHRKDDDLYYFGFNTDDKYKDLVVLFTLKNSNVANPNMDGFTTGYGFGNAKGFNIITANNLDKEFKPYKNLNKTAFVHELIHYLDTKRNPVRKVDMSSIKKYYNNPNEFNAYYMEAFNFVHNIIKDKKLKKSFIKNFKNFDEFKSWMINKVFDKDFILNLNENFTKKLHKRLYTLWEEIINI